MSSKIQQVFDGTYKKTYIICEEGVAHDGSLKKALALLRHISNAGAGDIQSVKFQKRHLPSLYTKELLETKGASQEWSFSFLLDQLGALEMSENDFRVINERTKELGLELIITPFDVESLNFIITLDNLKAIKFSSADLVNWPLLKEATKYNLPIILSTGQWTEDIIAKTAKYLQEELKFTNYAMLHCSSAYPSCAEDLNISFLRSLEKYAPITGLSSHAVEEGGSYDAVLAIAAGAKIIEKHICLPDHRTNPSNPDNKASLEPKEWVNLVKQIRLAEKAWGSNKKIVTQTEKLAKEVFAKSATAKYDLPVGHVLKPEDVYFVSPGKGLFPNEVMDYYGKSLKYAVKKDMYISEHDFKEQIHPRDWNVSDFRNDWGLKVNVRDADFFSEARPKFVEFHLSSADLDFSYKTFHPDIQCFVHAPEFHNKQLIDLCSTDKDVLEMSVHILQRTIEKTNELNKYFKKAVPKLIVHVGGASQIELNDPYEDMLGRALENIRKLKWNTGDLEFLPENLPRYASFFGSAKWNQYGFTRADDMISFCQETKLKMCWDSSHCILQCNATGENFEEYIKKVKPYISHLHLAQGSGHRNEGTPLNDPNGDINLQRMFELLDIEGVSHTVEIWTGHNHHGKLFRESLHYLQQWKHLI